MIESGFLYNFFDFGIESDVSDSEDGSYCADVSAVLNEFIKFFIEFHCCLIKASFSFSFSDLGIESDASSLADASAVFYMFVKFLFNLMLFDLILFFIYFSLILEWCSDWESDVSNSEDASDCADTSAIVNAFIKFEFNFVFNIAWWHLIRHTYSLIWGSSQTRRRSEGNSVSRSQKRLTAQTRLEFNDVSQYQF